MTKHSPLGGSGAERWMHCPGSVALLQRLDLPESDEPDYRREGSAMHALAEGCLKDGSDCWEHLGEVILNQEINEELSTSTQVYVDYARSLKAETTFVEFPLSAPNIHNDFYGTADFVAIGHNRASLEIVDLKGGKGLNVDPDDNVQLKYYAYGVIYGIETQTDRVFAGDTPVWLTIVQPRIAWGEAIKRWPTTVNEIKAWALDELVPAMQVADVSGELEAGDWCRFCPAKLVCPLQTSVYGAAAKVNPAILPDLSDAQIARNYGLIQGVKFYIKALEEETMRRALANRKLPGVKLVNKKAVRVWKEGAAALAVERFGDEAQVREIKSPPQLEKLGPKGVEFVKEFAYSPHTGYTVAPESDPRHAVTIKSNSEVFAAAVKALADGG